MEKTGDPPIHEGSNVIPFPERRRSGSGNSNLTVEEREVEILLCSLCGSGSFHLLSDDQGEIGCADCGFLIGAKWTTKGFVFCED